MRIHITNAYGDRVGPTEEPTCGSVVLTDGATGTAWQRRFDTGEWHDSNGRRRAWRWLLTRGNLVLVYEAPARADVDTYQASLRTEKTRDPGVAIHTYEPPRLDESIRREMERKRGF